MHSPSKVRPALRVFALALVAALAGLWVPVQNAQAATGTFSGKAYSDIVHVQAVNIPGALQVAEAAVAPATAEMSTKGVPGGKNSHAHALNVDADLLSGAIPLDLIVDAEHRAPGGPAGPVVDELLNLPIDPVLNASVAKATAHARWVTGGCVAPGTPISYAKSELADANVLTGTPLGTDAVVAVDNAQGDTVFSESTTELINVAGTSKKGSKSTTTTQITAITLFKGSANQLTINVSAPPVVTATATGKPGGAKVTYSEPVLQIVDAMGNILGELNAADANLDLDVSPLIHLKLGTLHKVTKPDGTFASGDADLLEVTVLNLPGALEPVLKLNIAGGRVNTSVPSGGVDCSGGGGDGGGGGDCQIDNPLKELQVGPSTLTVAKGQTFTYTKAVSNRGKCTLTNVKVVNDIHGPPGSKVISTTPKADSIDGLKVTWNDIGPLAPNQVKVLVVTVQVPSGASTGDKFTDDTTATATGGGKNYKKVVHVDGPTVGGPGTGACNLTQSKVGPSHKEVKPGETFNVYTSLLNSGGQPCHATVTLPIDDDLSFVSCTFSCTHDDDKSITWIVDIDPGESKTLTATLRVPNDAPNGEEFHHVVTIATDGGSFTRTGDGPIVSGNSILAPFPSAGGSDVGGASLPRTGFEMLRWIAAAMTLIAAGMALHRSAALRGV